MLATPHDKLFTEAFGKRENAIGVLRGVIPKALLERMDLRSLRRVEGSFIDGKLRGTASDILYSVLIDGRKALLYVLLEHKSGADRWTSFQLLGYAVRIWERCLAGKPRPRHLPPVIPLVVHHSNRGFRGRTSFLDVVDPIVRETPELLRLTPRFEFLVEDISHMTDEEVRARTADAFGRLALLSLRDARNRRRLVAGLRRWGDLFRAILRRPEGSRALMQVFEYLSGVAEVGLPTMARAVEATPEAERVIMTLAEQLRREGRKQGVAQGCKQGVVQGTRKLVAAQLRAKFGRLDVGDHRARP